ncbi:MAG TPA: SGNH/GDSL hydrolase family protein [Phycisphaerae bacterium]|nr:SGNH/GDSL hydrolase family protein [Phycisphaerae bacterium]HRY66746.1 SGNH/GDSL hydrolase family protein [Phycisphaerae bacterium]
MAHKVGLFAMVLSMIGSPECQPRELQFRAGDQIVAMGDSITQAGGYLRAIDAVLAQQYPDMKMPKVVNVGIGGQKAEDMVARFQKDVVARKPAIVTISVGVNDVWHRMDKPHDPRVLEAFTANVENMVKMAQAAGIKVLLVSPTVIEEAAGSAANQRLRLYIAAEKEIARRNQCGFVDLHALFLKAIDHHNKQVATRENKGFLTTDGVHMKPLGDTLMAVGILRALGVPDERIEATSLAGVLE